MIDIPGVEIPPMVLVIVPNPVVEVPRWTDLLCEGEVDFTVALFRATPINVAHVGHEFQVSLTGGEPCHAGVVGWKRATVLIGHFKLT